MQAVASQCAVRPPESLAKIHQFDVDGLQDSLMFSPDSSKHTNSQMTEPTTFVESSCRKNRWPINLRSSQDCRAEHRFKQEDRKHASTREIYQLVLAPGFMFAHILSFFSLMRCAFSSKELLGWRMLNFCCSWPCLPSPLHHS